MTLERKLILAEKTLEKAEIAYNTLLTEASKFGWLSQEKDVQKIKETGKNFLVSLSEYKSVKNS